MNESSLNTSGETDFNKLIDIRFRRDLNSQKLIRKLTGEIDESGRILQPYRYVIGLGQKHFKAFEREMDEIITRFPWAKKKFLKFVMHELILNTQISMLRQFIDRIADGKKAPGYFNLTMHINNDFCSCGIEEYGDFFDYYEEAEVPVLDESNEELYDEKDEEHITRPEQLNRDKIKIILTDDNTFYVPDGSNKLGLQMIENATDHDFYVVSFYKDGRYMWKRITFRIENDLD